MTGSTVPHLGIMFTFVRHSRTDFGFLHVIQTPCITSLAFGLVPTIFGSSEEVRGRYLTDVPRNLETLRFGSAAEIASTLALFRCSKEVIMKRWMESTEQPFPGMFFCADLCIVYSKKICLIHQPKPCSNLRNLGDACNYHAHKDFPFLCSA